MAECRGCGRSISLDCPYCPHCGKPCGMRTYTAATAAALAKPRKQESSALRFALIAAVGVFMVILWQLYAHFGDSSQVPVDQKTSQSAAAASP